MRQRRARPDLLMGRLAEVQQGGNTLATYTYNAQGQRTRKVMPSGTVVYHYDLAGNLISETTETGAPIRDYVWQDATPLAQIDSGATETLIFLHTDHLQTPRLATNTSGNAVWRWEGEAFGNTPPNQDVDGDGQATTINGRFPGQYADAETGFYYNWNRYYDANTGRYITSDPIGLDGVLNTYSYADSDPLRYTDPFGLVQSPNGAAACPTLLYNVGPPTTIPVTCEIARKVQRLQDCLGLQLIVTGGREPHFNPPRPSRDPHQQGKAVDFSFAKNPQIKTRKEEFSCCAKKAGFDFFWEEPNIWTSGNAPHFHLESPAVTRVGNEIPSSPCRCKN